MRRREFITLVGGAVAAWPLWARAQQPPMPVIGFLGLRTPELDATMLAEFRRGMAEEGFVEGRSIEIEFRWAAGHFDRLSTLADELVRQRVVLLVTSGSTASALAAKAATSEIPIVFAIGDDPVQFKLVASVSQPGGNITGITNFYGTLAAKQLGLLRELVPKADLMALLVNPDEPAAESQVRDAEKAARDIGQKLIVIKAKTEHDIDQAFEAIAQQRADALLLGANPFFFTRSDRLFALAARHTCQRCTGGASWSKPAA